MKWYEPDTRWDLYVKSRDEFVDKFVVQGRFHNNVPEDLVQSFETVSYLLAHSYYYWPMFDEAMSKALLTMEMAIKFKAKELGIEMSRKGRNRRLVDIINDVFKIEYLRFLKPDFDRARKFRNIKMHPDKNSFMGAMGLSDANIRLFINIINKLFSTKEELNEIKAVRDVLHTLLNPFKNGLYKAEIRDKPYLLFGFHTFRYEAYQGRELLILFLDCVHVDINRIYNQHEYPEPMIITLVDYNIYKSKIEGIDINGNKILVTETTKNINVQTKLNHLEQLKDIAESKIDSYLNFLSNRASWEMEQIIYNHLWNL